MWLWEDQDQGSFLGPFSFMLVLLLVVMRGLFKACVLSFYILLRFFSFQQVQALQVLKPRDLCHPCQQRQPRCSGEYTGGHLQAAKNGETSVELDIEFTSDGFPVLMLDNTVDNRQVWLTMWSDS